LRTLGHAATSGGRYRYAQQVAGMVHESTNILADKQIRSLLILEVPAINA